jgi:hypothetical protein
MFHSRPAPKVRAYRPRLEVLEDRTLPSTYLVDHLADDMVGSGTSGSLRYAITQAVNGDAINFGVTGTINLTGALPDLTRNISINGPGPNLLTVDGQHWLRPFSVSSSTVGISGLTIANGVSTYGGGIRNEGGSLTLSNCTVSGNVGGYIDWTGGGGIYNDGSLTLSNCTVSGNVGRGDGGGILNFGTATINNCTITNNRGPYGGGVANEAGGTMTIANSTISGNTASGRYFDIWGNEARGGGIYNAYVDGYLDWGFGNLVVTNCTITGNVADGDHTRGGGIASQGLDPWGSATLTINNCTISGNSVRAGSLGVVDGGGIYAAYSTLNMRNSILAGNISHIVGRSDYPDDLFGALSSSAYNLIGGNPLLGPLQDNGGPTQTMALLAGSPALNAGDPGQLGVPDQRGVVRRGGVNIGAYQASASTFVLSAPATATAGTAFNVTVKAVDPFGQTALGYRGTAHFSSADGQAVLPSDYTFTSGDAGLHTFTSGVTLKTAGNQTVTATDTVTSTITGSASVSVSPAAADHLLFLQQPTDTAAGRTITPAVTVAVVDPFGNVVTSDNSDMVTLSIGTNPSGGRLSGTLTVTVVNGLATFSDLSIDLAGDGYTLHARTTSLTDADSDAFSITA